MFFSISNIAWVKSEDKAIYELMEKYGFTGIDVAPGRLTTNMETYTDEMAYGFLEEISNFKLKVIGMQSLLYGTNKLNIFGTNDQVDETKNYLKRVIDFSKKLGVKRLVFGSPKNRIIGDMDSNECYQKAKAFFAEIGEYAYINDIIFCIEANPIEYGADFINTSKEAISFVKSVNHRGFGFHLDLGTMIINGENIENFINAEITNISHVHISVPYLNQVSDYKKKIKILLSSLYENNYKECVAIEMKNSLGPNNVDSVREALMAIFEIYKEILNE